MPMVAAAVAIAATAYSAVEQSGARKDQEQANEQSRRMEQVQSQRNTQMALRQSRIAQANVFAQGAAEGGAAGGLQLSSGVQGATGGFQSQTDANISFMQQMNQLSMKRYDYLNKANRLEGDSALAQAGSQMVSEGVSGYYQQKYYNKMGM